MSTQRFAVEFDRRVVGIAVRVPGGFMFFASDDDFQELDGKLFPRARAIARRLEMTSQRKRPRIPANQNLSLATARDSPPRLLANGFQEYSK